MVKVRAFFWSAFGVSALLFALATVIGTAVDERPPRPVVERGGYRVLEVDFHVHTRFTDGFLSPFGVVLQADRRGLDAVAITDHNVIFPAVIGRWFSRQVGGPTVLVGAEITTRRFHVHGVGLKRGISPRQPLPRILDEIHRQGGVAIAAHPVKRFWPAFKPVVGRFDGVELMHPIALRPGRRGSWRWSEMLEFYREARAQGHRPAAIGASDYHFFSALGICRTLVFARDGRASSIIAAVKARRTVVVDAKGRLHGHPKMISLLRAHPYQPRSADYNYRGTGWLDRVSRFLGWLAMLGILLFRRVRPD